MDNPTRSRDHSWRGPAERRSTPTCGRILINSSSHSSTIRPLRVSIKCSIRTLDLSFMAYPMPSLRALRVIGGGRLVAARRITKLHTSHTFGFDVTTVFSGTLPAARPTNRLLSGLPNAGNRGRRISGHVTLKWVDPTSPVCPAFVPSHKHIGWTAIRATRPSYSTNSPTLLLVPLR